MASPARSPILALRQQAEAEAARFPPLLAEALRIAASLSHGAHGRRRSGPGETFWEYRHHRREDGAAAVDWRRSAKGDHLFVRETEWEAANAIFLWRDGSPGMALGSKGLPTKRDRAAVCLIALAALLSRGGEKIAALGETGSARAGRAALEPVAQALAIGPGAAQAVETAPLPRHARVILASDFLEPLEVWTKRLEALSARRARGVMVRVIDPAEEDYPFTGRTRFKAPGGGAEPLLMGRAEARASAYRARWAEHGAGLAALAARQGWRLIAHRTDRPATAAVLALHQAVAGEAVL